MSIWQIILLGLVEGLTEYLPVSSTAHMMFTLKLLGIHEDAFVKVLLVSIQFGAILAVVVYYHRKFFDFSHLRFYSKLTVAVMPALVLGALFLFCAKFFLQECFFPGLSSKHLKKRNQHKTSNDPIPAPRAKPIALNKANKSLNSN